MITDILGFKPIHLLFAFSSTYLMFPFLPLFKKKIIELQLIFSVVLISAVQQSDSVIHIFSFIMVYHGISLCYTTGPCCLSTIRCICKPQIPNPSLSLLSPFLPSFRFRISFIQFFLPFCLDSTSPFTI